MNAVYRRNFPNVPQQPPEPEQPYNIVRDYLKLQGMTNPGDYYQPPRDVNSRFLTIQNSGMRPIAIAITLSMGGPEIPKADFVIPRDQSIFLSLNDVTGPSQYIYILDPQNGKPVGYPTILRRTSNNVVLRDGLNGWFAQFFHTPPYRGTRG